MMCPKRNIYLAGPIAGLTQEEAANGWRKDFVCLLYDAGLDHITCSSPMRGKQFLKEFGKLSSDGRDFSSNALATPAGVVTRDHNDVRMCDVMVACFLESGNRPSLGTAVEYGYCWESQTPIITVGPADDVNVRHIMLHRMTGYHVETLEEAAMIATHLLTPGL